MIILNKNNNLVLKNNKEIALIKVGSYYQGGLVFYIEGNRGIITALEDVGDPTNVVWPPYTMYYSHWGPNTITNATDTGYFKGEINSDKIMATNPPVYDNYQTQAVYWVTGYTGGGYTDWTLPTINELNTLIAFSYYNVDLFTENGGWPLGYFNNNIDYWSSSEGNQFYVYGDLTGNPPFPHNTGPYLAKGANNVCCRPVRYFNL